MSTPNYPYLGLSDIPTRLAKYSEIPNVDDYYTKDEIDQLIPLIEGELKTGNRVKFDYKTFTVFATDSERNEAYLAYNGYSNIYTAFQSGYENLTSEADAANDTYIIERCNYFLSTMSQRALDIMIPKKYFTYRARNSNYTLIDEVSESKIFTFNLNHNDYNIHNSQLYIGDVKAEDISPLYDIIGTNNNMWVATILYPYSGNEYGLCYVYYEGYGNMTQGNYRPSTAPGGITARVIPCCCIPLDTPTVIV